MRKIILMVLSLGVWMVCLFAGYELSLRRPLWNDELYTQKNTIETFSYADILQGRIVEGNNGPLFYLLQKGLVDLSGASLLREWKGEWFVHDRRAQVLLRVISNVSMSSAIAVFFYYAAASFSLFWALAALVIFLGVPATWFYWIEGRPYALWILLTVLQCFLFVRGVSVSQKDKRRGFGWLLVTHILLSLTIAFGAVQAVVASVCLWLAKERRWGSLLGLVIVPVFIAAYYFQKSPQFKFWFREGPLALLQQNVPAEYAVLFLISLAAGWFLKSRTCGSGENFVRPFVVFAGMTVLAACSVLGYLKYNAGSGAQGFAISGRYFLFLIPVISFALLFVVRDIWLRLKNDALLRLNFMIAVGGLLFLRAVKTLIVIWGSGTFMHIIR